MVPIPGKHMAGLNCVKKLDVQTGLYTPPVSLFEAQIGKLWPIWESR